MKYINKSTVASVVVGVIAAGALVYLVKTYAPAPIANAAAKVS